MSSPSVLLIGNFLSGTGFNRTMAEEFASRLEEDGWQVFIASRQRNRLLRLLDMLASVWLQRGAYQVAGISVFSGAAFFWAESCGFLLRWLRKPFFLILHGGQLPQFAARNPQRVRRFFSLAQAVIAPSAYLQEQMRPYRENIIVIPNPLETKKYSYRQRRSLQPRLVWLRAFHRIYNPSLAVETLALLPPGSQLKMVGPDKGDNSLQQTQAAIRHLGLSAAVRMIPGVPKDKVGQELSDSDIFLNTTNVDNTPISVLEAMTCGLCIVSTNVGGLPYLLEHEHNALLVPPDDPQAMAQAVRRLLNEPALAEKLSRQAYQQVLEQYDWKVILPRWEALLKTLTGETP